MLATSRKPSEACVVIPRRADVTLNWASVIERQARGISLSPHRVPPWMTKATNYPATTRDPGHNCKDILSHLLSWGGSNPSAYSPECRAARFDPGRVTWN